MFSRRGQSLPIGLDLGHDSVKLVQLQQTPAGPRILATARESIQEEGKLSPDERLRASLQAARRLASHRPFVGRTVAACLPRELVQLKNLRLPVMPVEEVAGAVAFEAATVFGIDPAEAIFRHVVAGEVRQGGDSRLEVICLAARRDEVDSFVESFHAAGLQLSALEFEPAALFRGVQRFEPFSADAGATVVLDIGYRRTQVIVGRGENLQFFKPIDIGSRRLTAAVARKLGITEKESAALRLQIDSSSGADIVDESVRLTVQDATRQTFSELIREVALCLRYFSVTFRGVRVRTVRIVGGEANCQLLRTMIAHDISIPLEAAPAVARIDGAADLNVAPWCLPIGLSLGSATVPAAAPSSTSPQTWESSGQSEIEVVNA